MCTPSLFRLPACLLALMWLVFVPLAGAEGPQLEVALQVGDAAPEFTLLADSGEEWKSTDHVGEKILVVYFYPADMTGGCTKQACAFRDDSERLQAAGVEVVGVSGDSVRNHQLFKQAHDLNFTLLADVDGAVASQFGVPVTRGEKTVQATINGEEVELVRQITSKRWTFVIDRAGKIAYKNDMVDAAKDSQTVLEVVRKLN
jgi:peroxiredoxin Q/BCP